MKARALLVLLFLSGKAEADSSTLPIYTYSIHSGAFQHADILLTSFDQPIPNTLWRCAVSYAPTGIRAECTFSGLESTGVAIRATCATMREDSQTVNLTTLSGGYASVSISCQRLEPADDGF